MTKEDIIKSFDCNAPGIAGQLFGLPFTPDHAELIIIPVPWEVTVSYQTGTAKGPEAILKASSQVDLAMKEIPDAWRLGISMLPVSSEIYDESARLRELAARHIQMLDSGEKIEADNPVVHQVNTACENLNIYIKNVALSFLKAGKMVGLLGGDHSTPLGLLRALSEQYPRFGILQFDAHLDLRKAYEGFAYSHASIMYNALKLPNITRLVQVGIRDYCDEELNLIKSSAGRVITYFDEDVKANLYEGKTWNSICDHVINNLPKDVYISFDIDGLNPVLCPSTGTPVPGGLDFEQAAFLIKKLVKSGRRIIGFDLNEVAPGDTDWDANVGARLLYHISNWTAVSNGKLVALKSTA